MGENDLQNQIVQVLATVLGVLKQEELELALLMMDEEGRNQLIQFVASAVQLGQVDDNTLSLALQLAKLALQKGKARKAEFGAKLEYIKKLQGGGSPRRTKTTPHSVNRAKRSVGVDSFGNKRRIDAIEGRYGGIPTTLIRTITEYPARPGFIGEPLIHPSDTNIIVKTPYGKYQGDTGMFNELYEEDPATFDLEMVVNTTRRDRARNAANERKYKARRVGNSNKNKEKNDSSNILGTAMTLINPALGFGTMIGNNIRKALGFKKGGTLIPKHLAGNAVLYYNPNGSETEEVIVGKKRNRFPRIVRYSNNNDGNPQEKITLVTDTKSYPLFEGNGFLNNIWKKSLSQAFTNMFNSVPLESRKTMDLYDFPNNNKTNPYKIYNKK